jgi:hypothetical protein
MGPTPHQEKPRSFWNGWRLADAIVIISLIGGFVINQYISAERISQLRTDFARLLTVEEALAIQVRDHHEMDATRDSEAKTRLDALERLVDHLERITK